jgi:hypothetical protein
MSMTVTTKLSRDCTESSIKKIKGSEHTGQSSFVTGIPQATVSKRNYSHLYPDPSYKNLANLCSTEGGSCMQHQQTNMRMQALKTDIHED